MPAYPKSPPLSELTPRQWQWIAGGYVLTLSTMPGQTIFIAQFNASIRETFGLSHGDFGLLYAVATLGSAICLVFAGGLPLSYWLFPGLNDMRVLGMPLAWVLDTTPAEHALT